MDRQLVFKGLLKAAKTVQHDMASNKRILDKAEQFTLNPVLQQKRELARNLTLRTFGDVLPLNRLLTLLNKKPDLIRFVPESRQEAWKFAVGRNPALIRYATKPSEEVQLAAVRKDGEALKLISKEFRTDAVRFAAVKQKPGAIKYIEGPNEDLRAYMRNLSGRHKAAIEKHSPEERARSRAQKQFER